MELVAKQTDSLPLLSVCIPAHNEEGNIGETIDLIAGVLTREGIPFEFVIANDNSTDGTQEVVESRMRAGVPIRLIRRSPPGGFGRAIRSCLDHFHGDVVAVVMADHSDDAEDIVKCYRKINEGYDAVFGSRFMPGSVVTDYPRVKLFANRVGNKLIQFLFRTRHNDLTNAFKLYRATVIRSILPLRASHFNITIEISLGLLIRGFKIAAVPVNWYGRTWGCANFRIGRLGRRYLATLCKLYSERVFIIDDVMAEHECTLSMLASRERNGEEVVSNTVNEADTGDRRSRVRGV